MASTRWLTFLSRSLPQDAPARPRAISLDMELTLLQSLRIFRKPFFLACFFANLVGVGSAVFIIASARQLWRNFDPNEATKDRNQTILVLFSIFTGVGNVAAPIITDALHKRGIARRSRQLAGILLYHGLVFAILALLTIVPALRSGGEGWKVLYQIAMASTGLSLHSVHGRCCIFAPTHAPLVVHIVQALALAAACQCSLLCWLMCMAFATLGNI